MKVVETWQTEQQDDSAVGPLPLDQEIAHIRVLTGHSASPVYVIPTSGTSLGRTGGDCDVVIDDGRMSRKHARIERSVAGWQLQDLGARNRGFVNGRGYGGHERIPLSDGAVLRFGDTLMVFRASLPAGDGRPESPMFPGVSPPAVAVRKRIDALAQGAGHVLIVGETGAGKERIAQAIGAQRAPHPFVTLNSAQLSRELARSELFGHVRGAFTNANTSKSGLVDLAGDGVLFLDEIGELWIDVQAELLRFLEDGSYRPLGATELRHSGARVVAATHVDLDQAVTSGKFRRDLLGRLRASNTPLEVPPLRERREDILSWTQLFFRERNYDTSVSLWTVGALECLLLYPWLSNLRELRSVVGEVVEQEPVFPCGTEHLPARLRNYRGTLRTPVGTAPPDEPNPNPSQHDPTKKDIEDELRATQGNMRLTAQQLGIDRRKLYRLCERFGIARESYRADTNREEE
ncbi:MAG TPA: sigma 54-interacting transcriptional regulator [Kofleriaceae bacterium]|jgi:DNA-binding NtrC family response regulator|nr:sigma 54-interacting transcriptional regulator [Kofleriaceae bacterium]